MLRALLVFSLTLLLTKPCIAQTQNSNSREQLWPAVNASFELSARSRITAVFEKRNGEDTFYKQEKVGATFTFRVKRFVKLLWEDVDKENAYNLVLGAG